MQRKFRSSLKIAGSILCVFMAVCFLASCGSNSASTQPPAKTNSGGNANPAPVTISVSNYPTDAEAALKAQFDGWIADITAKYPYITVKPDEYRYDVNTFFARAASGQLATVNTSWFTEIGKIVTAGYAADVTAALSEYGYDKTINPDVLNLLKFGGKYYGVPTSAYAMGLMYNVKLWADAGLVDANGLPKFPKTWDELAQSAQTIKQKTGQAGFFMPAINNQGGWEFMNIAWSFGAEFEKQVDGKWTAAFNSPEAVSALQYVKDLKWKYDCLQDNVLQDANGMFQLLGTDQCATAMGTTDWIANPVDGYGMSKDNLAMSAIPAGPKDHKAVTGGNFTFIAPNATQEQIDAAMKWLIITGISPELTDEAVVTMEQNQQTLADKNDVAGIHGMRIWVEPARIAKEDEIYTKYLNVNKALFADYMDNGGKNIKPEEPVNAQELYKAIDGVVSAVLTDENADPKALLDAAVAAFQKDYLDKAAN